MPASPELLELARYIYAAGKAVGWIERTRIVQKCVAYFLSTTSQLLATITQLLPDVAQCPDPPAH